MGVEYSHYFIVEDPQWLGSVAEAKRVHSLLQDWGLVAGPAEVADLGKGRRRVVDGELEDLTASVSNVSIRYPFVDGVPGIERIMGPSYYPSDDIGPRYFQRVEFVVGTDYRLHPSDERFYIDSGSLRAIEAPPLSCFAGTVPASRTDAPPSVAVHPEGELPVPPGFDGVWRAALCLDCGKDLPAFAEQASSVPGSEFRGALSQALGTSLVEIGYIY